MVDLQMFFMLRKGLGVSQVGNWGVAGQGFFGGAQAGAQGVAGLLTKRRRSTNKTSQVRKKRLTCDAMVD